MTTVSSRGIHGEKLGNIRPRLRISLRHNKQQTTATPIAIAAATAINKLEKRYNKSSLWTIGQERMTKTRSKE